MRAGFQVAVGSRRDAAGSFIKAWALLRRWMYNLTEAAVGRLVRSEGRGQLYTLRRERLKSNH
jgi:hypothetical protein